MGWAASTWVSGNFSASVGATMLGTRPREEQRYDHHFEGTIAACQIAEKMLQAGKARAIGVSNFSPDHVRRLMDATSVIPVITDLAARYGKTPAQVVLRWHLDEGRSALPKSVTPSRIAQNIDVFGFTPEPGELTAIDALDTGLRGGPDPTRNC